MSGPISSDAASLTALGHLPDYTHSDASDVSEDGSVVAGTVYSSFLETAQAFRWTRSGGMVGLGHLFSGYPVSRASRISADGTVIVGASSPDIAVDGAFIWTQLTGMIPLIDDLPANTRHHSASGISADGTIVVGSIYTSDGNEAFRWSRDGGMVRLGAESRDGIGISADGTVIVGDTDDDEPFRWTEVSGVVGLGFLPGSPLDGRGGVSAISADGEVVVGASASAEGEQAFRWTPSEGMTGLGHLKPDSFFSAALSISGNGLIIGGHSQNEESHDAFLWTSARGMRSLWDILVGLELDPAASGWTSFTYATAFSFDGRIVVGMGQRNGTDEAFIADLTPQLSFSIVPAGFQLAWPAGFQLQSTPAIGSAPWQNVTAAQPLAVSFGAANEFFRLIEVP